MFSISWKGARFQGPNSRFLLTGTRSVPLSGTRSVPLSGIRASGSCLEARGNDTRVFFPNNDRKKWGTSTARGLHITPGQESCFLVEDHNFPRKAEDEILNKANTPRRIPEASTTIHFRAQVETTFRVRQLTVADSKEVHEGWGTKPAVDMLKAYQPRTIQGSLQAFNDQATAAAEVYPGATNAGTSIVRKKDGRTSKEST